jgi:hypothetical protein
MFMRKSRPDPIIIIRRVQSLPQSHPSPAAILGDEFDASGFERGNDFGRRVGSTA